MQLMNSSRFKMQISEKAHGVIAFEFRQGHYENKLISGQNWQNRAGKDTEWQHSIIRISNIN
ncbi:hypothetical protein BCIN_03g07040 [Botrytis cinerea B05.10]|uniref:Uncharacterized protein n=2 Tax=Botryotinia fuckeliana (strain B05.10) TaxID=332648 RepID=A0A384JD08_BOTFB|nr:hypothetical protein BCIN_03g07040 [Botrytis cinerea B05.10]ATZ48495.1 hypothetical protein BCIN_03g07040 [Botrytis cinerea B05.10]